MDKIIVYETYYNPIEANIVKARLLDSDIQCFLSDENTIVLNPLYNQALGGVRLHIFEKDLPVVRSLLNDENVELAVEDIENGTTVCPKCGSNNVGYVQPVKKRFNVFTIVVSFLLAVYPFYSKKVFHCFNCGNEF